MGQGWLGALEGVIPVEGPKETTVIVDQEWLGVLEGVIPG